MMEVLHERHLTLSRKKSRMGSISRGFHFLGIDYPPTQTVGNTNVTHANDPLIPQSDNVHYLATGGGKRSIDCQMHEPSYIVPHPRTLRKAREQVKHMVIDGTSSRRIRNYLHRWVTWWVKASDTWKYQELIDWFLRYCWDADSAAYAVGLHELHLIKLSCSAISHTQRSGLGVAVAA